MHPRRAQVLNAGSPVHEKWNALVFPWNRYVTVSFENSQPCAAVRIGAESRTTLDGKYDIFDATHEGLQRFIANRVVPTASVEPHCVHFVAVS